MRIILQLLILLCLIILFASCDTDNQKYPIKLKVSDLVNQPQAKLKVVNVIPLNTTDSNLIGHVDKLKIYKDRIFVFDKDVSNNLFCFKINGNFQYSLKKGKAKGEVIFPYSFSIRNDSIFLRDNTFFRLYNLDGSHLTDMQTKSTLLIGEFECYQDKIICAGVHREVSLIESPDFNPNKGKVYGLQVTDAFGQNQESLFFDIPIKNKKFTMSNPINQKEKEDEIIIARQVINVIYTYNGTEMQEKYIIDFGDKNFKKKEIQNLNSFQFYDYIKSKKRFGAINFPLETDSFFTFSHLIGKHDERFLIYLKRNKEFAEFSNLLKSNNIPYCQPKALYNNLLVCIAEPALLSPSQLTMLNQIIPDKEINVTSNPILILIQVDDES